MHVTVLNVASIPATNDSPRRWSGNRQHLLAEIVSFYNFFLLASQHCLKPSCILQRVISGMVKWALPCYNTGSPINIFSTKCLSHSVELRQVLFKLKLTSFSYALLMYKNIWRVSIDGLENVRIPNKGQHSLHTWNLFFSKYFKSYVLCQCYLPYLVQQDGGSQKQSVFRNMNSFSVWNSIQWPF